MKVKTLIKRLSKLNENEKVEVYGSIYDDGSGNIIAGEKVIRVPKTK